MIRAPKTKLAIFLLARHKISDITKADFFCQVAARYFIDRFKRGPVLLPPSYPGVAAISLFGWRYRDYEYHGW